MNENAADAAANIAMGAVNEAKSIIHLDKFLSFLTWHNLNRGIITLVALLFFFAIYFVIRRVITTKAAKKKLHEHTIQLILKILNYVFFTLIVMYILGLFGIKVTAIWGAAGIAGVALGFASQTSVSNLISGFFVVSEKTMKINDFIEIDGVSGTVDSIGLLSVKIHTMDNQLVRIPNSMIIDTKFMNYSTFPYRRYVCEISLDYDSNVERCMYLLLAEVPERCPTVLTSIQEYMPNVYCMSLGDKGINIQLIVWCNRNDIFQTRSDVCRNIIAICQENGIRLSHTRMDIALKPNF